MLIVPRVITKTKKLLGFAFVLLVLVASAHSVRAEEKPHNKSGDSPFVVKPVIEDRKSESKPSNGVHCPPSESAVALTEYMNDLSSVTMEKWKKSKYSKRAEKYSKISFVILRSGKFKDVKIAYSSGNKRQDRKALQIVKRLRKFRELPKSASDKVEAQLGFGKVESVSKKK